VLCICGDSAAVIDHGYAVIDVNDNVDVLAKTGHGLVHAVVHDLVDKVVQAHAARAADVHGGALAHGLKAFEHLYAVSSIFQSAPRKKRDLSAGSIPHHKQISNSITKHQIISSIRNNIFQTLLS
jgi:hypothetical protein